MTGPTHTAHHALPTLVSRLWTATLVSGIASVALGLLIVKWPGKSLVIASALFGANLLISGIAQVIFAFALHVSAGARFLLLLSGAASVALAVLAFRHIDQGYAVLLLAIWIGIGFVFRGVSTTAAAVSDHLYPGRAWAIFAGIVTFIAGLVTLAWPFDSIAALTLVVGIWLVVIGVFEIGSSLVMRRELTR